MSGNLSPLNGNILVRPDAREETSQGGILLLDEDNKAPTSGTVLSVGRGVFMNGEFIKPDVAVGDKVLYPKFAGTHVEDKGVKVLVLNETEIFVKY